MNDFLRLSREMQKVGGIFNPIHALGRLLTKGFVRPAGSTVKNLLLGVENPVGALAGTRQRWAHAASKLKGYKQLTPAQVSALPPEMQRRVSMIKIDGTKVPALRKTTFGGAVGLAQRHPFVTGGSLVGLYALNKRRQNLMAPAAPQEELAFLQQQMQPYYQPIPQSGANF